MGSTTPVETCRAICPSSQTKVFFGAEIDGAKASDGTHYTDLKTAFLYRKHCSPIAPATVGTHSGFAA